jgi:ABC-type branched-subunit amino acid transport system ATPase component
MGFIGDDRSVFMEMSAQDNFRVGRCSIDRALEFAPELVDHRTRRTGLLSGGQQQILTVARALARQPIVLLADELSLGLAPMVIDRLLGIVRKATESGLGVVLVEQQVRKVLAYADRVYVMRNGRIVETGPVRSIFAHPEHEYTQSLFAAILDEAPARGALPEPSEGGAK